MGGSNCISSTALRWSPPSKHHQQHTACPANLSYTCPQDLAKRYEAKDQKCNELRDKLKITKAALSSKERELDMAQRLLQKLGQEKAHLRVRLQKQLQRHTHVLSSCCGCHRSTRQAKPAANTASSNSRAVAVAARRV
jgi:chromosome segregation ATPase